MQGWVAEAQAGTLQLKHIAGKRGGVGGGGGQQQSSQHPKVPARLGGTRAERRAAALAVLGFGPSAVPDLNTLKAAYRTEALKWHPDRTQNHDRVQEATENFQRAKESFDALARASAVTAATARGTSYV